MASTVAVFDSGFGGLTVLRALLPLLPGSRFLYLGDTARLPYGAKSQQTIARYAVSSAAFLLAQGAEMLVVACNTATALAFDELQGSAADPGGRGDCSRVTDAARSSGYAAAAEPEVLVLATAATVESGAYSRAFAAYAGSRRLRRPARCWCLWSRRAGPIIAVTAEVLRIYLGETLAATPSLRTLVLGCTHYPLLKPLIERTLAGVWACHADRRLSLGDGACRGSQAASGRPELFDVPAELRVLYATDSVEKFKRLGSSFSGPAPAGGRADRPGRLKRDTLVAYAFSAQDGTRISTALTTCCAMARRYGTASPTTRR